MTAFVESRDCDGRQLSSKIKRGQRKWLPS
jgi:hypothetical protein